MYFHKNNFLLKILYPSFLWEKPASDKLLYLSFDDGPIPDITEWVLNQLENYQAKATFFCVGDNIRKYPAVFNAIIQAGHAVGNHTFNHKNGWKTPNEEYLHNVTTCQQVLGQPARLFRPPYGKITRKQARELIASNYQIVMWDVLSGDFDASLLPETCFQKTVRYTEKGSIIVFHDSLKAWPRLQYVLPKYLAHFSSLGYRFEKL